MEVPRPAPRVCLSAREYITTLEYLRAKKELQLSEQDARKTADTVSTGCTGASQRFIETHELLLQTEMSGRVAYDYGVKMALASPETAATFQNIFKEAYVRDMLDLDADLALKLAFDLADNFTGSYQHLAKDFHELAKFCLDQRGPGFALRDCAELIRRLARLSEKTQESVHETFQRAFGYLTDQATANLGTRDALHVLEQVLPYGAGGWENFRQAFEYSTRKEGLGLSVADGVKFSLGLVKRTR